jgi:hypothetical protein
MKNRLLSRGLLNAILNTILVVLAVSFAARSSTLVGMSWASTPITISDLVLDADGKTLTGTLNGGTGTRLHHR